MKRKIILLAINIAVYFCIINAQTKVPKIFVATSEQEMYQLFNQMIDSSRLYNRYLYPPLSPEVFSFGYFEEINSKDTIMKVKQVFYGMGDRTYVSYVSNRMSIAFYERFLSYLKEIKERENYFLKDESTDPLPFIINILIKQYESGILSKNDSVKALQLIEESFLRQINDAHWYRKACAKDKYMTDKIRQALVNVIDNPFYPSEYLDFYINQQDTIAVLDTTGIPANLTVIWKVQFTPEELEIYNRDLPLRMRLDNFLSYEKIGREEYNGLSAGQAYLQKKKEGFREKGYLPVSDIAEYAYKKKDKLLIKHLKEFKKKHPDYPLTYF